MKKLNRYFAAAISAALALGTLAALPASAEEAPAYQMGDVNMDGRVDAEDAVLMLQDYVFTMLGASPTLTEEQYALADLDGYTFVRTGMSGKEARSRVTLFEAQVVLTYYTYTQILQREYSMNEAIEGLIQYAESDSEHYVKS